MCARPESPLGRRSAVAEKRAEVARLEHDVQAAAAAYKEDPCELTFRKEASARSHSSPQRVGIRRVGGAVFQRGDQSSSYEAPGDLSGTGTAVRVVEAVCRVFKRILSACFRAFSDGIGRSRPWLR